MYTLRHRALAALVLAHLIAAPAPARAQLSVATTADVLSGYHWRGLTLTNRPVLQPSLTADWAEASSSISLTAWSNLEPAAYDGARDLSALQGQGGFTELDFVLVATHTRGRATFVAGAQSFLFATPDAGDAVPATTELIAGVEWDVPLAPRVTWYQDVAAVTGTYVEAALAWTVPRTDGLELTASAGASTREAAYYERDGITHAQLDARWPRRLRGMDVTPVLGVIHGIDPVTRVTGPTSARGWKIYGGLNLNRLWE